MCGGVVAPLILNVGSGLSAPEPISLWVLAQRRNVKNKIARRAFDRQTGRIVLT